MKTTSTIICALVIALTFSLNTVNAQCNSPRLRFVNPSLESGTALQSGATYKFSNIMSGVNCFIKIKNMNGGATLVAMETPDQGYSDAWQPIIKGPSSPVGNRSSITFEIEFKTTSGNNYSFPCLDVASIDIDGDGVRIGEFVEAKDYNNFTLPTTSLLTPTSLISNVLASLSTNNRFQGPWANRPSIDTSAEDVRVSFSYSNKNKFELTLGSYIYNNGNNGAVATERLNCVYFSKITGSFALLPVNFLSFNGNGDAKKVVLDWVTTNEVNNDHYEVERSFNNNDFKTIGMVMDAISAVQNKNTYKYMDNAADLKNNKVAYYRLKQVSTDNKVMYSDVIAVRLQSATGVSMIAGPNPFTDKINLNFIATENASAEVRISNITGKTITVKKYSVNKGNNNIQVNGLGNLSTGMYMVQLVVNGIAMDTQKMIKN